MLKTKIIPIKDLSTTKYIIEIKGIEKKYRLSFKIGQTVAELNELPLNEKILGNDLVDIKNISFGDDTEYFLILTDLNLNIYFTKLDDNCFQVEIDIFSFKDSYGFESFDLDNLNINFELDFKNKLL